MKTFSVVVADKERARFFDYKPVEEESGKVRNHLTEFEDIVNDDWFRYQQAEKQDTRRADFPNAGAKSASQVMGAQASNSGFAARSSMSDSENAVTEESIRRFAKRIVEEAQQNASKAENRNVVVVAPSKMLAALRIEFQKSSRSGLKIKEVEKELSKMSIPDIEDFLMTHADVV